MRCLRHSQATVLGYRIERLDEYDDTGLLRSIRYEVICPHSGTVLGSHASMRAAQKHVILHELRTARQLRSGTRPIGAHPVSRVA